MEESFGSGQAPLRAGAAVPVQDPASLGQLLTAEDAEDAEENKNNNNEPPRRRENQDRNQVKNKDYPRTPIKK
jgi:hypothetical protein